MKEQYKDINSYITQGATITVQTAVLKETLEDNKDILNNEKELIEDVAFVTKMFFKDVIKNRGGELKWENLERMIDMMRIAKIRQILKEKEKEQNNTKNIL